MAKIKVHVLNFHGIFSHVEIVLENMSTHPRTYYGINRWEIPGQTWSDVQYKGYIAQAGSVYSFEIDANPDDIVNRWKNYWIKTQYQANILGENCAMAAHWFLMEFAGIPKPSLSNLSWNHLALGIIWPSFIPCPVTLPGRIMSNVKFHIEARNHPEVAAQYSHLFLYTSMALAILAFSASIFALTVAVTVLSGGGVIAPVVGCVFVGLASTQGFFKSYNLLSTKNMSRDFKKVEQDLLFTKRDGYQDNRGDDISLLENLSTLTP